MIHFIHEPRRFCHTDRSYLTQWFHSDTLIITDVDINEEQHLQELVDRHWCKNVVVDLSHNAMPISMVPDFLKRVPILCTEYNVWYLADHNNLHYFPLWLWMFSLRSNQFFGPVPFDAAGTKTKPMMCLNRQFRPHRQKLLQYLEPILPYIEYTDGTKTLPGDKLEDNGLSYIDIGVGHRVYSECAVNIVTETVMDRRSLSEKSCKPFVARQIPLIVGPVGINQFLNDIGLDLFPDLVPWSQWDAEQDENVRVSAIADFAKFWFESGKILQDYHQVRDRVERNKQYFHSDSFRQIILKQMPYIDPYQRQ